MTLQLLHALVESLSCFSQGISIEANAIHLHFGKNRNQWHFDIPKQVFAIYLFEFWLKNIFQSESDVSIFGCIFIYVFRVKIAHRLLRFALGANQLIYVDGLIVEIDLSHVVHIVTKFWLDDIMSEHGVEHFAFKADAIVHQHLIVVLDVLSNF